jgi:hypothetical protein
MSKETEYQKTSCCGTLEYTCHAKRTADFQKQKQNGHLPVIEPVQKGNLKKDAILFNVNKKSS